MYFNRERPANKGAFAVPDSPPDKFNDYSYGTNYLFEYLNSRGIDNLLDNYPVRDVTYLVGAKDKSTDDLDNSLLRRFKGQHRKDRSCILGTPTTRLWCNGSRKPRLQHATRHWLRRSDDPQISRSVHTYTRYSRYGL